MSDNKTYYIAYKKPDRDWEPLIATPEGDNLNMDWGFILKEAKNLLEMNKSLRPDFEFKLLRKSEFFILFF